MHPTARVSLRGCMRAAAIPPRALGEARASPNSPARAVRTHRQAPAPQACGQDRRECTHYPQERYVGHRAASTGRTQSTASARRADNVEQQRLDKHYTLTNGRPSSSALERMVLPQSPSSPSGLCSSADSMSCLDGMTWDTTCKRIGKRKSVNNTEGDHDRTTQSRHSPGSARSQGDDAPPEDQCTTPTMAAPRSDGA